MSFRRTLGNIIIFFAVLGIIINTILFILVIFVTSLALQFSGVDQFDLLGELVGKPIAIIVGFVWLGIGILIRGKNEF